MKLLFINGWLTGGPFLQCLVVMVVFIHFDFNYLKVTPRVWVDFHYFCIIREHFPVWETGVLMPARTDLMQIFSFIPLILKGGHSQVALINKNLSNAIWCRQMKHTFFLHPLARVSMNFCDHIVYLIRY